MTNAGVNIELEKDVESVPAYKFLPLFYQMVSRLSQASEKSGDGFQRLLRRLIVNIAKEHPHHSLFQLFALKNGSKVRFPY